MPSPASLSGLATVAARRRPAGGAWLAALALVAGCANAPDDAARRLDEASTEADAGPALEGAPCVRHEACSPGLLCLFDGAAGRCARACALTGDCPESAPTTPATTAPSAATGAPDGAACTAGPDCAGGTCLGPALGYPAGHCTTAGCGTSGDCHGVSTRCLDAGGGTPFCVAACSTNADCRPGYGCASTAGAGYCAPLAGGTPEPEPDPEPTPAPESEPPPPPEPAPVTDTTFTEFCGDVQVEQDYYDQGYDRYTLNFEVPTSATAFQVLVGAQNNFGGFESLDGERLDIDFARDFQRVNMLIPTGNGVSALQLPHVPGVAQAQLGGSYTLRIASQSAPYCPVVVAKYAPGTRVELNVSLTPGNGVPDAAVAAQDPNLQRVLAMASDLYRQADITLSAVHYRNLDAADQARFAIVRSEADLPALFSRTESLGDSVDAALTLNLIVVQQILIDNGNVLGVSAGIPGPAGVHGFSTSGVVMTAAVLADADIGSQTMAHELGHFLGLYHTTEIDSVMADPLGDTPECPAGAWQQPDIPCPDASNLMFPYAHAGADITAQQVQMLHASPLVK